MLPKGSELWLDGGHNASAARLVADHVRRGFPDDLPFVLVFASLKTKSPRAMLKPFRGLAAQVHTLPIPYHDHFPPEALAKLAGIKSHMPGMGAARNDIIERALRRICEMMHATVERRWQADGNKGSRVAYMGMVLVGEAGADQVTP